LNGQIENERIKRSHLLEDEELLNPEEGRNGMRKYP